MSDLSAQWTGRLERWTALAKDTRGRIATAYFDMMAALCSRLLGGQTQFSRPVLIASCILTSLTVVVICVLFFIAAPVVHALIDGLALLVFGMTRHMLVVMQTVFDALSYVLYWLIIVFGYAVHVLLTVGSVIVGIGAVNIGALAVYLSVMIYDHQNSHPNSHPNARPH